MNSEVKFADKIISVSLFGACDVSSFAKNQWQVNGTKKRVLIALLVTAPFGRRNRKFLQETLWGKVNYQTARQSLRRALSDIKKDMGSDFDAIFENTNSEIQINLPLVFFAGRPGDGLFLEGLDVPVEGFVRWKMGIRENPSQLYSLFSLKNGNVPDATVPSIAVLPFLFFGGNKSEQLLGDWLAEEVSRSLSRSRLISVISHLSSRQISTRMLTIDLVRSAFNVDYCITGSIRRSSDTIVFDADFVDVRSGRILSTRRFETNLEKLMSVDSTAIAELVIGIGKCLAEDAIDHVSDMPVYELDDHHLLVAGVALMHKMSFPAFARSRELIEEVIRRAPASAEPLAWLAEWYVISIFNNWSSDRDGDTRKAKDALSQAMDIDPKNAFSLTIRGVVENNLLLNLGHAEELFDTALTTNPNSALTWLLKGMVHAYRDDGENAVKSVTKARRLSPLDPFGYFYDSLSATAYASAGLYDNALELANKALKRNSREISALRVKILSLHQMDKLVDARIAARELMHKQPNFNVKQYLENHPAGTFDLGQLTCRALIDAGIPK